jgi:hypothetical protein
MMKSLGLLLGLFFWGMVLKCLSEAMDISVTVTQAAVKWAGYGLWAFALLLLIYRLCAPGTDSDETSHTEEPR